MQSEAISVLIVEDDAGQRRSIVEYLQDSGFTTYEAASGEEGIVLFRQRRPDLVFTDLNMANGHGLQLITQLREESPLTPVVVISGTGVINDAVDSMKRGAWDFITKPVRRLSELEELCRKLLKKAGDEKERQRCSEQSEQDYRFQRLHDALTGLPNRLQLGDLFRLRTPAAERMCLILLDLNNFKIVNANFGHRAANELLCQVAARLTAACDGSDILAHLGGDEFAILSNYCEAGIESFIRSLEQVFAVPFAASDQELFVSASLGVASWPGDGGDVEDLLRCANIAICRSKEKGRTSVQYYDAVFGDHVRGRIELETSLRRALERHEFLLHYQPQIEIATGRMSGVEALVRWQRNEVPLVAPSNFIPILEESGLIIPVGEWILRQACRQYVEWQKRGVAGFMLSVNISATQFKSGTLPAAVIAILQETGMSADYLCLELTESVVMDDVEETVRTLGTLRELGVSLSIDDFGTGYSSLSYLRRMPISELKIDRSFISTIPFDQNNTVIVNSIISMAQYLNLKVVAEGVETREQLQQLADCHCQIVQGFYFSEPVSAEGIVEFARGLHRAENPSPGSKGSAAGLSPVL
jgi:diguanylate cyclase (GGDEF)-like protein